MDDVLETWRPQPLDVHAGSRVRPSQGTPAASPQATEDVRRRTADRRAFIWKAALLGVSTLALVPVLWLQSIIGGALYVGFLLVVHVAGLAIFLIGVRRQHIGITPRGMAVRIGGLVALVGLLYLASKGLAGGLGSAIFWYSLTAIWALHTAGAAMLHLMPEKNGSCPFA